MRLILKYGTFGEKNSSSEWLSNLAYNNLLKIKIAMNIRDKKNRLKRDISFLFLVEIEETATLIRFISQVSNYTSAV